MTQQRSRRAVLVAAAGAAGATALGAVVRPVLAGTSDDGTAITIGSAYGHVDSDTSLYNPTVANDDVFSARTDGSGAAFRGSSASGIGVFGSSFSGTGVRGETGTGVGVYGWTFGLAVAGRGNGDTGTGVFGMSTHSKFGADPAHLPLTGVHGYSDQVNGVGVYGQTTDTTSETYGVQGRAAAGDGRGVFGWALSEASGGTGVWGQSSSGTGVGVRGYAWDGYGASGTFGTGVLGSSGSHAFPPPAPLGNTGVYGVAKNGRGGVFKGDKAQVRLIASTATSHPASGALGDLFLDKNKRLWFCKGGLSWTRIA